MELAVFGAILIFVIGAIVRQALSAGTMQNQQLRAMRQAMSTSYRYSTGLLGSGGADGDASHQTATILFVEDRLTADSAKYGAIDRTPSVVSASASYSRNLFLPVDANEHHNLPVFDIFINGRHFPFTVAAFKKVELARNCAKVDPCSDGCDGDCSATSIELYPGADLPCVNKAPCPLSCGGDCDSLPASSWEPECVTVTSTLSQCISGDCIAACPDFVNDCTVSPGPPIPGSDQLVGCPKLYSIVYNHRSYLEWCDGEAVGIACPAASDPNVTPTNTNLIADERFDLDRSGLPLAAPTDVPVGPDRTKFSWQWYGVAGYNANKSVPGVKLEYGAPIVLETSKCKEDCDPSQYTAVDVDGDLKLESIMVDTTLADKATRVIRSFTVMDSQDGDIDMSRGDSDTGPAPGLDKDVSMYSRVRNAGPGPEDGTYLLIEEGKLYIADDDASQYIRTTQKKDQIDLVVRRIQLSNDTHRFCDSGGKVVTSRLNNDPAPAPVIWTAALPNPVEACSNDCFDGANVQKTCMDQGRNLIFVRSRVADLRGRKWITSTQADEGVEFTLPSAP